MYNLKFASKDSGLRIITMSKIWILIFEFLAVLADQPEGAQGRVYTRDMSPRTIDTKYGKLKGMLVEIPNKHLPPVEAYLGLAYASLLGGNLRFMPPTSPMEQWNGVRVAISHRQVCPQKIPTEEELFAKYPKGRVEHFKRLIPFLKEQSEDCLNLNVYVPTRGKTCLPIHYEFTNLASTDLPAIRDS
jgi:neuroligin